MLKRMIFTVIALSLITPMYAADGSLIENGTLALIVAILALAIAVINFFRIKRVQRIHEVDFLNLKDDFTLTLERFKTSLNQEFRNNRRDFQKPNHPPRPNVQKQVNAPATPAAKPTAIEQPTGETQEVAKKPKKRYYHRRKPGGNRTDNNQAPKE